MELSENYTGDVAVKSRRFAQVIARLARTTVICAGMLQCNALYAAADQAAPAAAPGAGTADAQPAADQDGDKRIADIIVTGSRITRSGFSAPTPTTVVGVEDFNRKAASNVAAVLNDLPSFRVTAAPTVLTVAPTVGGNFLDLRGLGIGRTLTLVNGQRFVPSNGTGQVDLNLIPSLMIARTDIVTGGASAAYGSDAVAGVVNLIYKRDLEGVEGNAQYGISSRGDNREKNLGLVYGATFGDGRGHVLLGGQYVDNEGVGGIETRAWGRHDAVVIPNPAATATNGLPTRILIENARNSNITPGGLITSPGALAATQFLAGGVAAPFTFGDPRGASFMSGGSGYFAQRYVRIEVPTERQALSGYLTYDLTDNIEASLEGSWGRSAIKDGRTGNIQDLNLTVRNDNPFLPASVRTAMATAGVTSFTMARRSLDIGDPSLQWLPYAAKTTAYRGVAGLNGSFGDSWKWHVYDEYGHTELFQKQGNRVEANWRRAINAVTNPATGATVCRDSLSSDAAVRAAAVGCVPYNIFGSFSRSPDAAAYVSGTSTNDQIFTQNVAAGSLEGEPFSTWAGPVSLAVGGEYRRESIRSTVDALSLVNGFNNGNSKPIRGTFKATEAFMETVVPLAKDARFAQLIELNGAVRYTHYSLSGNVVTWKIGLNYSPVQDIRLRFTRSRDVRAPNLSELYTSSQSTQALVFDPVKNTLNSTFVFTGGNATLKPERANTTTAGIVFQPSFMPRFKGSIDFYDINLKGAISTLAAADVVGRCAAGNALLCARVTRDATGTLTAVSSIFENLQAIHTRGIDFEAAYRQPLAELSSGLSGNLTARLLATYVDKTIFNDGRTAIDLAGDVGGLRPGGLPHWTGLAVLIFENGPLTLSGQARYVGGGKYDALGTPANINFNHVPSRRYYQLSGSYRLLQSDGGRNLELFGAVDNLLDRDPPIAPTPNNYPTNPTFYDTIGRTFKMGVRFKY